MLKRNSITVIALILPLLAQTAMAANGNPMTERKVREIVVKEIQTNPATKGPKGDTGAQGPKGDTGAQGPAGNDATVIITAGAGIKITGKGTALEPYVISAIDCYKNQEIAIHNNANSAWIVIDNKVWVYEYLSGFCILAPN